MLELLRKMISVINGENNEDSEKVVETGEDSMFLVVIELPQSRKLLMGNEEGPVKKQQVIDARLRVAVETPDDFSLNYFSLKMPCAITAVGRLNQRSILIYGGTIKVTVHFYAAIYGGTIKVYGVGGSPSSSSSIIRMDIWCIFSEYLKAWLFDRIIQTTGSAIEVKCLNCS
ncbi:hypothetical protein Tco_1303392 [Tanacetum coccineum]